MLDSSLLSYHVRFEFVMSWLCHTALRFAQSLPSWGSFARLSMICNQCLWQIVEQLVCKVGFSELIETDGSWSSVEWWHRFVQERDSKQRPFKRTRMVFDLWALFRMSVKTGTNVRERFVTKRSFHLINRKMSLWTKHPKEGFCL